MCQFTSKDPVKKHRPFTHCRYTGQVAGPDGGCGTLLVVILLAAAAAGPGLHVP